MTLAGTLRLNSRRIPGLLDELQVDFLGVLAILNDNHHFSHGETAVEGLGFLDQLDLSG